MAIQIKKSNDLKLISWVIHHFCNDLKLDDEIEKVMLCQIPMYQNYLAIDRDIKKIVGGAGMINNPVCSVAEYLWIAPSYRKKSIGGLLCRQILKDAKGNLRIMVNTKRLPIYQKLGFKTIYHVLERR